MSVLWLVTPVHGREALTRICFEQRALMLNELAGLGVEARQLVVGTDANLATAREFGFHTLRRDNPVGWRVNEGIEWACAEGADFVSYCGSDDWHLADYFANLPAPGTMRTSYWQAFVSPNGDRLVVKEGKFGAGRAPWVISRAALEECRYRPADDSAMSAVDASIADGLTRHIDSHDRVGRRRIFAFAPTDQLRVVDFKGGGEQITPWERAVGVKSPRVFESRTPFEMLATRYPAELCGRMEKFYAEKRAR